MWETTLFVMELEHVWVTAGFYNIFQDTQLMMLIWIALVLEVCLHLFYNVDMYL